MPHLNMPMTRDELAQRIFIARMAKYTLSPEPHEIDREVQLALTAARSFDNALLDQAKPKNSQEKVP